MLILKEVLSHVSQQLFKMWVVMDFRVGDQVPNNSVGESERGYATFKKFWDTRYFSTCDLTQRKMRATYAHISTLLHRWQHNAEIQKKNVWNVVVKLPLWLMHTVILFNERTNLNASQSMWHISLIYKCVEKYCSLTRNI